MKKLIFASLAILAATISAHRAFGQAKLGAPIPVSTAQYPMTRGHSNYVARPGVQPVSGQGETIYYDYPPASSCGSRNACDDCNGRKKKRRVNWLMTWDCDELKMEPAEKSCGFGGIRGLLWCPPAAADASDSCNAWNGCNGQEIILENGNGNVVEKTKTHAAYYGGKELKKSLPNGNKDILPNREEVMQFEAIEEDEEDEETVMPFMAATTNMFPGVADRGIDIRGFTQFGFTHNTSGPVNPRHNFGVNMNDRSNDFNFNQAYMIFERALQREGEFNFGWRLDAFGGQDAPDLAVISLGLFDRAWRESSTAYGLELPQFYASTHLPILTDGGLDVHIGRMYTRMGWELWAANDTDFYSHAYEFFYGLPFTHTGVHTDLHLTDTIVFSNGMYVGWDNVFTDNNDAATYQGALAWTSCDKNQSFTLAWITGPEQDNNSRDYRTLCTAYYQLITGRNNQWRFVGGGHMAWDDNASGVTPGENAEWYGMAGYVFYTVTPKIVLGTRGEWFRDDDGARTGFATSFWEWTMGVTFRPFKNLRFRPECRMDWADSGRPFNDGTDNYQMTLAMDMLWEF